MRIPEGTQSGRIFRLRNKGIQSLRAAVGATQLVEVRVVTPQKLTKQQKDLLREFAKAGGAEVPDENKSFFKRVKDAWR